MSNMSRTARLLVGKTAPTCRGLDKKDRKKRILSCMFLFMLSLLRPAKSPAKEPAPGPKKPGRNAIRPA
jgi:hypothetical protein